ncbi:MAG: HD domain-containing protein [Pirellulaceae bacterium]|nr:HD domain-containing protein [Pirellulaceae bacterium]
MPDNQNFVPLAERLPGQSDWSYVVLAEKKLLQTKTEKPYFRITLQDNTRKISFPLWQDSRFFHDCQHHWCIGSFYKVYGRYLETDFGPQIEIRQFESVTDDDYQNGFHENVCLPQADSPCEELFDSLLELVQKEIDFQPLADFVVTIYQQNRSTLLLLPAATQNHHTFLGGYLTHVLSVTETAVYLAEKYIRQNPEMNPPLEKDLVVAGAALHDIGKLRELELKVSAASYTPAGELIGHILQGRDILRETQTELGNPLSQEMLLRLEHIIVSHQRLPEWGSPKPPMTPEALLVHYADDIDAKFQIFYETYQQEKTDAPFTQRQPPLRQRLFRGLKPRPKNDSTENP